MYLYFIYLESLNDELVKFMLESRKTGSTIKVRYGKALLTGSCGAGKSSFFRLLMKKQFEQNCSSTGLADLHPVTVAMKAAARKTTSGNEVEFIELDLDKEILQLRSCLLEKSSHKPSAHSASSSHLEMIPEKSLEHPTDTKILTGVETYLAAKSQQEKVDENNSSEAWEILTFIDSGGQPSYINMLPTISSSVMVTFIVYNMEGGVKSLQNPITVACRGKHGLPAFKPYPLSYNNLELIKNLIAFTSNMFLDKTEILKDVCAKKGSCASNLALIGTHSDRTEKKAITEMDNILFSMVSDAELRNVWANLDPDTECLIPINNTTAGESNEDSNAAEIRNNLYECLQKQAIYDVPIVWLLLELEIRKICKDRNCSIVSYSEVLKICQEKKLGSEEVIQKGLRFHHLFGVLLYYENVEGMKSIIITDHQWLLDSLTAIVLHSYTLKDTAKIYDLKQGILDEKILDDLDLESKFFKLSDVHLKTFNIKKSYLNLLIYLKIIAPMEALENFSKYFMPSLLPSCNLIEQQTILDSYKKEKIVTEPLLVNFTCTSAHNKSQTLPRGVFCCLAVVLINNFKWKLQWDVKKNKVFQNLITFYKSAGCYITLIDRIFHLEVLLNCEDEIPSTICYQVYSDIDHALQKVGERLGLFNFNPNYGFLCKGCKDKEKHFTKFVPNEDESFCCYNKPTKLMASHTTWFKKVCTVLYSMVVCVEVIMKI